MKRINRYPISHKKIESFSIKTQFFFSNSMGNQTSIEEPINHGINYKTFEISVMPRTCREKITDQKEKRLNISVATQKNILLTEYAGIWSKENLLEGQDYPSARVGHFTAASDDGELVYIGYGATAESDSINDFWEYNAKINEWKQIELKGDEITPRQGARAVFYKDYVYVFGGFYNKKYLSDFHRINSKTGEVEVLSNADEPASRSDCYIAAYNDKIVIFGGFNFFMLNDMHIFDINEGKWHEVDIDFTWSTSQPYDVDLDNGIVYSYGGCKGNNLLVIDINNEKADVFACRRLCHNFDPVDGGLVFAEGYLFCYGGKTKNKFAPVFALDTKAIKNGDYCWFMFFVLPDNVTTSYADGVVSKSGLFIFPNSNSFSIFYQKKSKTISCFLGWPLNNPPPIYSLDIGKALPIITMRKDMQSILFL